MTLFHRTFSEFDTFNPLSFFTEGAALEDESFGDKVIEIEWSGKLASDDDVNSVAEELGFVAEDVDSAYEYLSPNLGEVENSAIEEIVEELKSRGFEGAKVSDFCCETSVVIFDQVEA